MSDALRRMVTRHLLTPCTIRRAQLSADGAGGRIEALSTVETTTCRIEAIDSTAEIPDALRERLGARQPYRFTLPDTSVARPGDRLVITGHSYDIVTAPRPTNAVALNGICVEV